MKLPTYGRRIGGCHRRHHGAVLICVLACLVIVGSLVATSLSMHSRSRRESKRIVQLRQVELLLDAGVARAIAQMQRSKEYTGETWALPPAVVGIDGALIEISVGKSAGARDLPEEANSREASLESAWSVTVAATLHNAAFANDAVRRNYTFRIQKHE